MKTWKKKFRQILGVIKSASRLNIRLCMADKSAELESFVEELLAKEQKIKSIGRAIHASNQDQRETVLIYETTIKERRRIAFIIKQHALENPEDLICTSKILNKINLNA